MASNLPIVMTAAGAQPQSPAALLAQLLAAVAATNPGYTANLPGSLVEDISSTDVGAVALCDAARVELVNSMTPNGANAFVLAQLGAIYGVSLASASNTSVEVVFSGSVGYVIPQGFVVSDGSFQYNLTDGGIIGADGSSPPLSAVALLDGSWSVPANTVTQLVTSVPSNISLSVTNPQAGTPGTNAETETDYRARVLQAGLASAQGMQRYLKTLLGAVTGVQSRLVSVRQQTSGGWEVICGGASDNYQVAYAIFQAIFDVSTLVGSTIRVTGITQANPGKVTTDLNHGLVTGQTGVAIAGSDPANYDGSYTVTVVDEKNFTIGVDTSAFPAYIGNASVTPNTRNVVVSITDYPDVYAIRFVVPPQQTVNVTATWNTTASNFTQGAAVAQLAATALVDYINSIEVGAPINLLDMTAAFQAAVEPILPSAFLTRLVFAVSINGVATAPSAGESFVSGDPESYFFAAANAITVVQG